MGTFEIAAVLVTLAALASYVNHRYVGLPTTIGVMALTLGLSMALVLLGNLGVDLETPALAVLTGVDLEEALLHGMLGFLLFAGALHINLNDLVAQKWTIGALATFGVLVSTTIVGGLTFLVSSFLELGLPFVVCLLFGALISPTDPIAVLGIMRRAGAPRSLEIKVAGESLFNDGIGVVIFLGILALVKGGGEVGAGHIATLFVEEAIGGAVFGLGIGWLAFALLKRVDNYQVEVLLTLALVMGGYAACDALHMSGPIAMVVAGLLIGNQGRAFAMSETTRRNLDTFWELVDEILNTVLFALLGLELLVLSFSSRTLVAGLLAIPVVLLARLASVGGVVTVLRIGRSFTPGAVRVLVWGGLRGGISVALALSLPAIPERGLILAVTYCVVVFSILVQGLTVAPLIGRVVPSGRTPTSAKSL